MLFERGSKSIASFDHVPVETKGINRSVDAHISETLSLVSHMHKDEKSGLFQEKLGRIIVRQKVKGIIGDSYRILGELPLRLHLYATSNHQLEIVDQLTKAIFPGTIVKAIIKPICFSEVGCVSVCLCVCLSDLV